MRLLLTHAFFLAEDPKEQQVMRPYPPLGILYLSSYLRAKGFDVDVYDSTFGSRAELFNILEHSERGWLGISANLLTRGTAIAIATRAKGLGWRVIFGGPEPVNYPDEYLASGADYIVQGEGEVAIEYILSGNAAPPGTILRMGGKLVHTTPALQIANLDSLPWPDRERIDLDLYLRAWRDHHGKSSVSLITARGCPYHCRWCSHSTYGKTHRRRSVPNVADEVEAILERYHPDMLWYADDVFTIHPGWTLNYAAELRRRGFHVPFECITRADRLTPQTADALAEMGCFRVWIGSESGSQKILDSMQRGVTTAQVEAAVGLAKARGIEAGMFLMWGYEGEQLADIEATVDHVTRCRPDTFLTTVTYPIKGTPYHQEVEDKLVRLKAWTEGTDRDVHIRGRHSRRYYRFADDLLRATVAGDAARAASARLGLSESAHEVEA